MSPTPPITTKMVRDRLSAMTPDQFTEFCQDNFPEIYLRFGDGLTLSERIIKLLDHYLVSRHCQSLVHYLLFGIQEASITKQTEYSHRAHELLEIHHFDLRHVVDCCLNAYYESTGPLVIGFRSTEYQLLDCLQRRLIGEFGEHRFHDDRPGPIKLSFKSIDRQTPFLYNTHMLLDQYIVIRVFIIEEQGVLDLLLSHLNHIYTISRRNRPIILLGLGADSGLASGLLQIEAPRFKPADIHIWMNHISKYCQFPDDLFDYWHTVIWRDFYPDGEHGEFDLTRAYGHLDFTTKLLSKGPIDPHEFRRRLEERARLYA